MYKKIAIVLAVMISFMSAVVALDASTPYEGTVKWIVPSTTTFTVTYAGAETTVDFDTCFSGGDDVTNGEPDSQSASGSTPIIEVQNTGNVNLDFNVSLGTAKPAFVTEVKVGDTNVPADADAISTVEITFSATVTPTTTKDMYWWTNVTDGTPGTTERQFNISVETS